jgi:hypothetical protein
MNPDKLAEVLDFLRELSATGPVTRVRYQVERRAGLPHPTQLAEHGHSWNGLLLLAGLPVRYRANKVDWTEGREEEIEVMMQDRELNNWFREGLPVVESSARTEVRRAILPGGRAVRIEYQIVSLR